MEYFDDIGLQKVQPEDRKDLFYSNVRRKIFSNFKKKESSLL